MIVNHSSPVPIPTLGKQEHASLDAPAFLTGFPIGTIPNTPGPIQAALDRETNQSDTASDTSPARLSTGGGFADPMPTPMPGTNFGFSDNDLDRANQGQHVSSSPEPPTEPSGYFSIPVLEESSRTASSELVRVVNRYLGFETQDDSHHSSTTGELSSNVNEPDEHAIAGQQTPLTHRCDPTRARCNHRGCGKQRPRDAGTGGTVCATLGRTGERDSTASEYSALNIEHIVFDDDRESTSSSHTSTHPVFILRRDTAHTSDRTVASQSKAPLSPAYSALEVDPVIAQATWGTHGSLYDGNGYGDTSSSSSTRPSTSSRVPEAATKATDEMMDTSALLAQDSVPLARDHENLEEAIRAYAALEAASASGISEDILEDVIAEIQADVELANQMADHSLGA
ncbi:hypothetical protein BDU57DRAFT_509583 [Ampelomyces quisqualis]|uniref:Uncharacterized protein n=1 Tax=Ampelomyces quisqualis TaxID=50730 RepID=A0A6A5R029_AMPQU|nr:hypothetical protein BDU57DRAFT_509583 [Ampelomyces quisqualis]